MNAPVTAPERWTWSKVKHIAEFFTGWTPPTGTPELFDGENLWANISDLGPKTLADTAKRISDEAVRQSAIRMSPVGSLLFSFKLSIGQVSFAARDMYTNEAIATFPPQAGLNARWAYWAFPVFIPANAGENIYGARLLNQELIRSADLLLPPLDAQERIANFLDEKTTRIDALIAEKERLLTLLAESEARAIVSLITGQEYGATAELRAGETDDTGLPMGWTLPQLARTVSKLTNGYVGPTRDILVDSGIRYLQSLHIKNGQIDFSRGEYFVRQEWSEAHAKSVLEVGDVLIVQTGDIGQTAVVTEEFAGCNCHALIIASPIHDIIVPEYLELVLRSAYGRACLELYATGALHPHLNCSNIRDVRIPLPNLPLQADIVRRAQTVQQSHRALASHASEHIDRLREYRASLIAAAVTGHLDLSSPNKNATAGKMNVGVDQGL